MDSAQDVSPDKELAGEGMETLGESTDTGSQDQTSHDADGHENTNDPLYVQKRLKQQKRAHEREIRELHARIGDMQSKMSSNGSDQSQSNPYGSPGTGDVDEQIHKAVSYALQHKENEERKAKEAQNAAHVHRQYQDLDKHLDSTSDKYDDFEDVVRGHDVHFTPHMRDAALFLPKSGPGSAGEVLYHLGKSPEKLKRIADLHALDQASELVKLSHALISAGDGKAQQPRPLGQIKNNPVVNASNAVTEKTPVSSIRQRMKSGDWK